MDSSILSGLSASLRRDDQMKKTRLCLGCSIKKTALSQGRCQKNRIYLGLCLKHRTPPTHRASLGQNPKKNVFLTIFGALKHNEMAKYDLPPYVLHVLGYFWMFALKITEWLFSLKRLGPTFGPTYPQFGTKSQLKPFFFLTPSLSKT